MKVYIAGKITGDPTYKAKFAQAEQKLKLAGHSVMSPAWLVAYPEFTHKDYCDVGEAMISCCDAVLFLADWEDSFGAKRERMIASRLKKRILDDAPAGWIESAPPDLGQGKRRKGAKR